MRWLKNNSELVEALAAAITALVALAALVGVKLQLDATDRLQQAQSARDAYRSHLALAVAHPHFASPPDSCALMAGPQAVAYYAYVDHLLYAAEQMLTTADGWEDTFWAELAPHKTYVCSAGGLVDDGDKVFGLMSEYRAANCADVPACP
ncbi:MAG: hypothetical protein AAF393_01120 [Pseudomonadota bacterium]